MHQYILKLTLNFASVLQTPRKQTKTHTSDKISPRNAIWYSEIFDFQKNIFHIFLKVQLSLKRDRFFNDAVQESTYGLGTKSASSLGVWNRYIRGYTLPSRAGRDIWARF